jgi:hypothetical protein
LTFRIYLLLFIGTLLRLLTKIFFWGLCFNFRLVFKELILLINLIGTQVLLKNISLFIFENGLLIAIIFLWLICRILIFYWCIKMLLLYIIIIQGSKRFRITLWRIEGFRRLGLFMTIWVSFVPSLWWLFLETLVALNCDFLNPQWFVL